MQEGDIVVLANSPQKIVGTITALISTPTDSFERALFTAPVSINELRYVFVENIKP